MCVDAMELTSNSSTEESPFSDSAVNSLATPSNSRSSPKAQSCVPTTTTTSFIPSTQFHLHQHISDSPVISKKIFTKNANGTVVSTTVPSNDAELQLYRIMQKASLLAYYDTLLEMGGDDVQQLCDAGEEEFLEIMALVGMASKPLHVRRFQKSLQEWMIDPSLFQVPLVSNNSSSLTESTSFQINHSIISTSNSSSVMCCTKRSILESNRPIYSPSPGINDSLSSLPPAPSPGLSLSKSSSSRSNSPLDVPSCSSSSGSSNIHLTPTLLESQILRLRGAAERIRRHLPQFEPKTHGKKKVCKELECVMAMPEDDLRRMEEIRKYAAIYGRFDCKRKPEKPLTLHEVSVNEAAAQICHFIPALLTRRDELFPLARQVVRDSGYLYSKGAIQWIRRKSEDDDIDRDNDNEPPAKRLAISNENDSL